MMRAVHALGRDIISRGAARATAYAARRAVRGTTDSLPLYRVDETGRGERIGVLDPVYPEGCALDLAGNGLDWPLDRDMRHGWFGNLPYPLDDMRPQGFLGRHFARRHADLLQVPVNPADWREDDILYALSIMGSDMPGNFILGKVAYQRFLDETDDDDSYIADDEALVNQYQRLAREALMHGVGGSSAAGEFPKFPARRRIDGVATHVLVKFSGDDDSPGTRRWSDLLVCEHLALEVIAQELGIAVAGSRIVQAYGRTFYEVVRFDRHGARGRSGVCTWSALNAALYGIAGNWLEAATCLRDDGYLSAEDDIAIRRIWHFGRLIANNDMHDGNLAFRFGPVLAPVYDMLPMAYAPVRGVELPPVQYQPSRPLPEQEDDWRTAARAALGFWRRAADDKRISAEFRRTCADNAQVLVARIGDLMPR